MEKEILLKNLEEMKKEIENQIAALKKGLDLIEMEVEDRIEYLTDAIKQVGVIDTKPDTPITDTKETLYTFDEAKELAKKGKKFKCKAWEKWYNGKALVDQCFLMWWHNGGKPVIGRKGYEADGDFTRAWFLDDEKDSMWYEV